VQLQCIVLAASDSRYIALSYVWGQVTCAKATKDNLSELVREGSLAEENEGVIVPRTIRHTMRLVELMGERFLWVDRLCISQDDEESKHMQLANMADIYANAYLTIIAANGWDAEHGLRGIQDVTEPRQMSPNFENDYYESLQPYSSVWVSYLFYSLSRYLNTLLILR
jgi:Heterokaryon incompatibility protein (HET)